MQNEIEVLIAKLGERAAIDMLAAYCEARLPAMKVEALARVPSDLACDAAHAAQWSKLARALRGALEGMKYGRFGRIG